ncbi:hypothetical protein [Chondrinema litorale]|uniref:hypothetical protein n=1 Tax=Chondrinema litorale TaxID=2994555 RepID=UPI002542B97A|nr:hypothetical protein [Chondrinema litorale]UZR95335.1 hypothetical protein OQ292_05810 [Chondrinema litorale]
MSKEDQEDITKQLLEKGKEFIDSMERLYINLFNALISDPEIFVIEKNDSTLSKPVKEKNISKIKVIEIIEKELRKTKNTEVKEILKGITAEINNL